MKILELQQQLQALNSLDKTRKIIEILSSTEPFESLSAKELSLLEQRDREDAYKLKEGIDIALHKGVLSPDEGDRGWISIEVDGKLPGEIFEIISDKISLEKPNLVLSICGDSGVGKGTLVDLLLSRIPHSHKWSNGDLFRVLTYWVLQQDPQQDKAVEMVPAMDFSPMVERIAIEAGKDIQVQLPQGIFSLDQIKNGLLKETSINRFLPSVARYTQGEVIGVVNHYLSLNQDKRLILEGREETLNYIDADYRIRLVLKDKSILGKRRAAQKIVELIKNIEDPQQNLDSFLIGAYR